MDFLRRPFPIGASKIVGYLVLEIQKITDWSRRTLHTKLITQSSKSNMFILTLSIIFFYQRFENYSNDKIIKKNIYYSKNYQFLFFCKLELNFQFALSKRMLHHSQRKTNSQYYIKVLNKYISFQWIEFQITNRIFFTKISCSVINT